MYDRRLDAILAASELGSFSKAAVSLHVSTTALVKQVNTFEAEFGVTLFERSRHGVSLTAAGHVFVEDARALVRQASDALRRARSCGRDGGVVRLGVSVMCPGRKVMDAWPQVHEADPTLKLELTPIGSIYDERLDVIGRLGKDVDLILTSWSPERWEGSVNALALGTAPLAIDVPLKSPLAERGELAVFDLAGWRVHLLRHANPACDALGEELSVAGVEVVEEDDYDLTLFNSCAERGEALVTSGAWSSLHPMLTSVPLAEPRLAECVLLYPREPAPEVRRFVDALANVLV